FGRDTLTASWQAGLLGPEMMRGTLPAIAALQGCEENDWRDEQPGKMIHQVDTGPLPTLNFNPLGRYYGSITTSGFYPVVVSELWHWTGDKELVQQFINPALKALGLARNSWGSRWRWFLRIPNTLRPRRAKSGLEGFVKFATG